MDKRSETVQFHLQHLLNWVEKTYIHEDDKPLVSNLMTYTRGFWKGLFTCYDHPHVPRTNNDHERFFRQTKTRHRRFPVACTCLRSRSFRLPIPLRPVKPVRIAGQLAHLVRRRASSEAFEGGHFPNFCTVSGHCFEGGLRRLLFATCLQRVCRLSAAHTCRVRFPVARGGFGIQRQGIHMRLLRRRVGVRTVRTAWTGHGPRRCTDRR